jgi:hypothetical protein
MKLKQIMLVVSLVLFIGANKPIEGRISAVRALINEYKTPYAELTELILLTSGLKRSDALRISVTECINRLIDHEIENIFRMMINERYDDQSIMLKIRPMQSFMRRALQEDACPDQKEIFDLLTLMIKDVDNFGLHRKIQIAKESVSKAISDAAKSRGFREFYEKKGHIHESLTKFRSLIAPYQQTYQWQLDECFCYIFMLAVCFYYEISGT